MAPERDGRDDGEIMRGKEKGGQSEKRGDHAARKVGEQGRWRGKLFSKISILIIFFFSNTNSTNQIAGYSMICRFFGKYFNFNFFAL